MSIGLRETHWHDYILVRYVEITYHLQYGISI